MTPNLRSVLLLGLLAFASMGMNCKHEYEEALKRIDDLNAQISTLQKTLPEAADKVDPLALKEVFRQNKTLAEQNAALQKLIDTGGTREGNINLTTEKLRMEILGHKGTLVVKGWIDTEDRWFVEDTLPDTNVDLPFPDQFVSKWIEDNVCRPTNMPTNPRVDSVQACRPQFAIISLPFAALARRWDTLYSNLAPLDKAVRDEATTDLRKFIARPYIVAGSGQNAFYFHERVGWTGSHLVHFRVKPVKPDRDGQWTLRYRLLKEARDGKTDQLVLEDVSPLTYPAAQVGTAFSLQPMRIDVRFDAAGVPQVH